MGRVYVTFDGLSFAVSSDEYVAVRDLLQEAARRAQRGAAALEAFLVDETTGREMALAADAALAQALPRDRADVVVRQRAHETGVAAAERHKSLGNELMTKSRFREAAAAYSEALASTEDTPLRLALLLNRSLAHMRLEEWAAAEDDARAAAAADPECVKARFRLGQALFYGGRYEEAHAALAAGLDMDSLAPQQAVDFGRLLERCEREHGAGLAGVDAATVAAARAAGLPAAAYLRLRPLYAAAEAAAAERRWGTAIELYRNILQVANADDWTSLQGLATCLLRNKSHRYEEATQVLTRLCELQSASFAARVLLAEALCGLRQWEAALGAVAAAGPLLEAERGPQRAAKEAELHVLAARALLGLRRPDVALQYASRVLREDESHAGALAQYGRAMLARGGPGDEEEALKASLRLVAGRPRDREAQRLFCEVLRRAGATARLLGSLRLLAGGRLEPSSLAFLAGVAKEYGALEAAVALLREAVAADPTVAAHALSLVHVLEIDARPLEALAAIRQWLAAASGSAVGAMTAAAVLRAWDARDASVRPCSLPDVPSRGLPAHLTPAQLEFVAMVFVLVKLLYLKGDWVSIPAIVRLLEPERAGWDFHLTGIRNEQAFYCCAVQCLESQPSAGPAPAAESEEVHVLGDSHCLPLAWRRVGGALLVPHLVTGCKMWHLRPEGEFFPKHNWQRAAEQVPEGGRVLVVLGEIDCREGLLVCIDKGRYSTLQEGVEVVVRIFLEEAVALCRRKRLLQMLIHPVPPVLNPTRHIVEVFNPIFRRAVEQLPPENNIRWLDLYDALVEPRQGPLPDCLSAFQLRPQYHLDGTHLNPRYLELLTTL